MYGVNKNARSNLLKENIHKNIRKKFYEHSPPEALFLSYSLLKFKDNAHSVHLET
jgi:hypothetical protein